MLNVDTQEVEKFSKLAREWWDADGNMKTLHAINAPRVSFIERAVNLQATRILDVGCGGGLLTESLADKGAIVTGLDQSEPLIQIAKTHAGQSGLDIAYRHQTLESFIDEKPDLFPVITCLECLEHVPEPQTMIAQIAELVAPGGDVFLSTINRNMRAYAKAIVAAEYVLGLLPRKTHDYAKFIKPHECARWARQSGLSLVEMAGFDYDPFSNTATLTDAVDCNYILHLKKH
jgi:2-polyprenyl-6-hydroxyphenyl methylase / 3-demethylubiquinone-9 3-methyltransferase